MQRKPLIRNFISRSPEETHEVGLALARDLPVPGVVLLRGSLGTGKTTLTRGLAEGLGLGDPSLVSSPSFTLVNIYQGRCRIYHVDLYRIAGARDIRSIGIEEFIGRDGITIVEWSERLLDAYESALEVKLKDLGGSSRSITVRAKLNIGRNGAPAGVPHTATRLRRRR